MKALIASVALLTSIGAANAQCQNEAWNPQPVAEWKNMIFVSKNVLPSGMATLLSAGLPYIVVPATPLNSAETPDRSGGGPGYGPNGMSYGGAIGTMGQAPTEGSKVPIFAKDEQN